MCVFVCCLLIVVVVVVVVGCVSFVVCCLLFVVCWLLVVCFLKSRNLDPGVSSFLDLLSTLFTKTKGQHEEMK